jgi:ATP-dependent Lon protease
MFTGDYGFIVDYLAEVMKDLRKEDFMKSYTQYFELSDSITTRDKTSIEKTFSGLVKVIYPHGEFSASEARELLDFAVECRKRVKDQLRKMDETFNDEIVRFEYTDQEGKTHKAQTLEVIEYGDYKLDIPAGGDEFDNDDIEHVPNESVTENKEEKKPEPAEGQKIIRENQTGVSYKKLFGNHLIGATEITVTDPYIRLPHQMKNFMELARLVAEIKQPEEEVSIHLKTNNNEDYISNSKDAFAEMIDSLEPVGIKFTYEFDENLHDRSIKLNNGWKILLGRGLDIFQKTNGWFDIADHYQEVRKCKDCEITYLREG